MCGEDIPKPARLSRMASNVEECALQMMAESPALACSGDPSVATRETRFEQSLNAPSGRAKSGANASYQPCPSSSYRHRADLSAVALRPVLCRVQRPVHHSLDPLGRAGRSCGAGSIRCHRGDGVSGGGGGDNVLAEVEKEERTRELGGLAGRRARTSRRLPLLEAHTPVFRSFIPSPSHTVNRRPTLKHIIIRDQQNV